MSDKRYAIIWDLSGTLANTKQEKLYPGAEEILKKASEKYKQALITTSMANASKRIELIKKLRIWDYFDLVKVSRKTEEVFLNVCKELDCKPENTFVIGDGIRYGPFLKEIPVGNKLGMKTIWVDYHETSMLKEKLRRIRYWKKVKKLSELEEILEL